MSFALNERNEREILGREKREGEEGASTCTSP
jgi:hypothetical protein